MGSQSTTLFSAKISVLVIILFAFIIVVIHSSEPLLTQKSPLALTQFKYLKDDTHSVTLANIQKNRKALTTYSMVDGRFSMSFGHDPAAHWLMFNLHTQSSGKDENCLMIDTPVGAQVDLHISALETQKVVPVHKIISRKPAYCFNVQAQQLYKLSVRVQHEYDVSFVALYPTSLQALGRYQYHNTLILSLLLGGLLLLTGYNVLLYFSLYEKGYLYIAILASGCAFELSMKNNLLLLPEHWVQFAQYIFPSVILMMCVGALGFVSQVVVHANDLRLGRFLQICMGVYIGLVPIVLWLPHSYTITYRLAFIAMIISFAGIIYASYLGSRVAQSALLMSTFASSGFILSLVFQFGGAPYLPNFEVLYFSSLLMAGISASFWQNSHTRLLYEKLLRVEEANKAKDKLLATVSHELRTPAHTLLRLSELLIQKPVKDEANYLKQLRSTSLHLSTLIDDILDVSSLESSKINLESSPICFKELIADLELCFEVSAQNKDLTFHVLSETDIQGELLGDQQRLTQVLINLLTNAIKYSHQGQVTLQLQVAQSRQGTGHLYCEVRDTGIGIAEEHVPYLFRAFYQVQDGYARSYGGTGLGLSISQQLVMAMGSEIQVVSQLGKGSRFFFELELPVVELTKPLYATPPLMDHKALAGLSILLVDDDVLNANLGRILLVDKGATVSVAYSGKEAIQHIQVNRPDLIFMDISMPEMDGYETVGHIRKLPEFKDLPIAALTAHALEGERERCLQAGMDDYLTKPYTADDMLDLIFRQIIKKTK